MTGVYLIIFFGSALVIGIYFLLILLWREMDGRPRPKPDNYDFGFAPVPPDPNKHP